MQFLIWAKLKTGLRGGVLAAFLLSSLFLVACGELTPTPIPGAALPATPTARTSPTTVSTPVQTIAPTTASITSGLTKGKLKEVFPALANLTTPEAISSIYLNDSWDGLNPAAPLVAKVCLQRQANGFDGLALYNAGHDVSGEFINTYVERTGQVQVPQAEINRFLQMVSELPVVEGVYNPKIDHTDDYPSLLIQLNGPAWQLKLYSQSQGGDKVPWGLNFNNQNFVINTADPERAYEVLKPYFKASQIQEELIREVSQKLNGTYTPSPFTTMAKALFPICGNK